MSLNFIATLDTTTIITRFQLRSQDDLDVNYFHTEIFWVTVPRILVGM